MAANRRNCPFVVLLSCVLFFVVGLFAVFPGHAYARSKSRSYSMDKVDIAAQLNDDGSLQVRESRTFTFDGQFNGVYWNLPLGTKTSDGQPVDYEILSVEENGLEFSKEMSSAPQTYQVRQEGSNLQVTVYTPHKDESATVTLTYRVLNAATRWSDTGELYWKFVADGWEQDSHNVHCTLTLPVPTGASVNPGDNVRAWGHGSLDGTVEFSGQQVVYQVNKVNSGDFAEMRVVFPADWLDKASEVKGRRLKTILTEEQDWADQANAKRSRARIALAVILALPIILALATLSCTIAYRIAYRRRLKAASADIYYRDVPTTDHPAVLSALYDVTETNRAFIATMVRLTDMGVLQLQHFEDDVALSLKQPLPELAPSPSKIDANTHTLDKQALDMLLKDLSMSGDKDDENKLRPSKDATMLSDLEAKAKNSPEDYNYTMEQWQGSLDRVIQERFHRDRPDKLRALTTVLGVITCGVALVGGFLLLVFDFPIVLTAIIAGVLGGIGYFAFKTPKKRLDLNDEGMRVKSQLEALRRWLCEFTSLDEAIPTDVVLWNRLLVMAVGLGVSEIVIKQLQKYVPEVLEQPELMPTYSWYYLYGDRSAFSRMDHSMTSASAISMASVAASSFSSGGGGGGGFSGGGGGGFGGGGGGGAF